MASLPENIYLFRLVHRDNVEHILKHGICVRTHPEADPNYVSIGHTQLISDRDQHPVRRLPGAGVLGEYVPFYFGGHSPMLLMIKTGHRFVEQRSQSELVYLICGLKRIRNAGLEFIFTDRNAKLELASFYRDPADLSEIDWEVVRSRYWSNTEADLSRMERKQAEFLVREYVPVDCIDAIVTYDDATERRIKELTATFAPQIRVVTDRKHQYFYPE